jgi:hypothetical protein
MTQRYNPKRAQDGSPSPDQPLPETSLWKKSWLWCAGTIAGSALLLTNISTILSAVRELPSEVGKTSDQFWGWYGDYEGWKGYWSNHPEGSVDMAQMNLSSQSFRITIDETEGGTIAGTLETQGICETVPYFDMLLLDGTISSSGRAQVEAFEFVGGYRSVFARLNLTRTGHVITVTAAEDPLGAFQGQARIALHADDLMGAGAQEPICGGKTHDLISRVLNRTRPHN